MLETEKTEPDLPDYGMRILDYFYKEGSSDQKNRDDYLKRGLIPTNNLSLYIVDEPKTEIGPGIRNPFDYHQKPFGVIIENFKSSNPELWNDAKTTKENYNEAIQNYVTLLQSGKPISPDVKSDAEMLLLRKSEVYDKVIRIIGPQLLAISIDPLDLCK